MIAVRRPGFNTARRRQLERTGYIGLGSNLGDRRRFLKQGIARIGRHPLKIVGCSAVWESEPVGCSSPLWFLNMVVGVRTRLSPPELLERLLQVEREAGRRRAGVNAPRTLDLDLLLLGDLRWQDDRLCLPHPRMWGRRFVLEPLGEIAPDVRDPVSGSTVAEARERVRGQGAVRRIGPIELAV